MPNFGLGGFYYKGDDRDFSLKTGVTSRIKNENYIDLEAARIEKGPTTSDPSSNAIFGWDQNYKNPKLQPTGTVQGQIDPYRKDGDQHAQLFLTYRGQNFAMPGMNNPERKMIEGSIDVPVVGPVVGPGSGPGPGIRLQPVPFSAGPSNRDVFETIVPDLDVAMSLDIMVNRSEQTLSFAARMVGDGFPNAESFLLDSSSGAVFCVVHRRIGSASGQLHGNRRIAMAAGSALVAFPGDMFGSALTAYWARDYATHSGGPIDLIDEYGSKPTDVSGWNKMHLNHDAKGNLIRRWYSDNELHLRIDGKPGSSMP
ncbi:hypothetical protein C5750_24065 [Phyllobacterium myrsinacearum]|uniref:Uncharacterized protein n=2 Tax=Phyllobacteriaceae TaxID=69277 RepID=A0A2S9JAV9_9HYPH|nr:hypothetical protein C5750_24065 [Phyllobacterium myrsinacearum]